MGVDELIFLFGWTMFAAGVLTGLLALIAMLRRARRARMRGVVSVACLFIALLSLTVAFSHPPELSDCFIFSVFAVPGALTIIFVRPPELLPGHCMKCGYNLTGNTSGVCSECGTAVRCKACGYNLRGNVSGKCSECGTPVAAP